ncbi:hypothetical protein HMPREF0494_0572 [Limosilactobacillus antri DSM 16041]|uniref:Uncharacterized protein n=1 Tax=Limosilactobacillus antri DSM 16041 TaxID=525309 RepID=C8P5H8_9LACO|nr:hypothetical protein HMPREF0494_0572 [Limosilactobacillus antri DSM 16041]
MTAASGFTASTTNNLTKRFKFRLKTLFVIKSVAQFDFFAIMDIVKIITCIFL